MPKSVLDGFDRFINVVNYWSHHGIARSPQDMGNICLLLEFIPKISSHVSLDRLHFLTVSLAQISKAECLTTHRLEYEAVCHNHNLCDPRHPNTHMKVLP